MRRASPKSPWPPAKPHRAERAGRTPHRLGQRHGHAARRLGRGNHFGLRVQDGPHRAALGLRHTHITDPSGADPGTVSTPSDLIRLGEAAMRIPVFSQIVSLGETTLPLAGLRYNPNFDLGQDGIVGIAVGSDTATNGCFLFAAQKTVNGQTVTLYGAVLGQSGPNGPNTAAVDAGDTLVSAALREITAVPVFPAGHVVGELSAPWGASAPAMVSEPVTVVGLARPDRCPHGPAQQAHRAPRGRVTDRGSPNTRGCTRQHRGIEEHRTALGTLCVLAPPSLTCHHTHQRDFDVGGPQSPTGGVRCRD